MTRAEHKQQRARYRIIRDLRKIGATSEQIEKIMASVYEYAELELEIEQLCNH